MSDLRPMTPAGPDVTVVVTCFNYGRYLREAVDSALHEGARVIVVDDSREPVSIEGAQTVAMAFDSGAAAGRNEGLRHSATIRRAARGRRAKLEYPRRAVRCLVLGIAPRTRREWMYIAIVIGLLAWLLPFMAPLRSR